MAKSIVSKVIIVKYTFMIALYLKKNNFFPVKIKQSIFNLNIDVDISIFIERFTFQIKEEERLYIKLLILLFLLKYKPIASYFL